MYLEKIQHLIVQNGESSIHGRLITFLFGSSFNFYIHSYITLALRGKWNFWCTRLADSKVTIIILQLPIQVWNSNQFPLSADVGNWTYIWSSNQFSVSKAYKQLSGHLALHPVYRWIWRSSCQNKHKVFFWLLIRDRLSTTELVKRKNMTHQDFNCVLCKGATEESLTSYSYLALLLHNAGPS